jgi:hypothetical protein
LKYANPAATVSGALFLLLAAGFAFSHNGYYDSTSPHSTIGIGSFLLCVYGVIALIIARAHRVAERRRPPSSL